MRLFCLISHLLFIVFAGIGYLAVLVLVASLILCGLSLIFPNIKKLLFGDCEGDK